MVKILITFHANVNAVDDHGRTPLEYASFGGKFYHSIKIVKQTAVLKTSH